jgi:hypothetical protein
MSDRIGHAPVLLGFAPGHASNTRPEELVSNRILSLLLRSCQIAEAIEAEQRRSAPSVLRLLRLKQLRLTLTTRLQEVIGGLRASPAPRFRPVPVRPAKVRDVALGAGS